MTTLGAGQRVEVEAMTRLGRLDIGTWNLEFGAWNLELGALFLVVSIK